MIRESSKIDLRTNMKRKDDLHLSSSWKPFIHFLKECRKPPPQTQHLSWPDCKASTLLFIKAQTQP
jgi:hypothetical protein